MSWWNKKPKIELQIVTREQSKLRLAEFRADEKLSAEADKILNHPTMRLMLDVMNNEHLALFVMPPNVCSEERAARQAQIEGYTMALANLESMARSQKPMEVLQSTFDRDDDVANQ